MIFDFLTGGVSGLMPNGLNRIDADDPELSDYNMVPGMPTNMPFYLVAEQLPKQFTDPKPLFRFTLFCVIEIIYLLRIHNARSLVSQCAYLSAT